MSDYNIGSIDRRQLCLRFSTCPSFCEPDADGWQTFSPRRLLKWRAWKSAVLSRWNWSFWWIFHRRANHRCWCPEGVRFDGRICLAGFGVNWWYSHFTGERPCVCDLIPQEERADDEQ